MAALQVKMDRIEMENFGLQQELEYSEQVRQQQQTEIENLQAKVKSFEKINPERRSDESSNEEKMERYQYHMDRLKEDVKAKDAKIEEMIDMMEEMGQQLTKSHDSAEMLKKECKAKQIEIEALNASGRAEKEKHHTDSLGQELKRRTNEHSHLLKELRERESELEAGKRLLKRLTTSLAKYDPSSSNSSSLFGPVVDLDMSMDTGRMMDPDASIITPSSLLLSTPGGKNKVQRGFEEDLLDEIENARASWESVERKVEFQRTEESLQLKRAQEEAKSLSVKIQQLESQIVDLSAASSKQTSAALADARSLRSSTAEMQEQSEKLILDLQQEVFSLKLQLEQGQAEGDLSKQASSHKAQATIEMLTSRLEESNQRFKSIHTIYETLQDKRDKLASIQEKSQKAQVLETQLREHITMLKSLDAHRSSNDEQNQAWVNQAKDLGDSLQILMLQYARAMDGDDLATSQAEFEATKVELEQALRDVQALQDKKTELESTKAARDEAVDLASELHGKIAELEANLEQSNSEGTSRLEELKLVRADMQEQTQKLAVLESQIEQQTNKLSDLNHALRQKDVNLEKQRSFITELTDDLSTSHSAKEELCSRLGQVEAQLTALQSAESFKAHTLSEAEQETVKLRVQLADLESRVLRRNEQIGSHQIEISKLKIELEQGRTNQRLAEETCEELNDEKDELAAKMIELEAEVNNLQESLEAETLAKAALETEVSRLAASVPTKQDQNSSSESALQEAQDARNELVRQVEESRKEFEEEQQHTIAQLAALEAEQSQLSQQLDEAKSTVEALQAETTKLQSAKYETLAHVSTLELRLQQAEQGQDETIGQLQAKISKLETEVTETSSELLVAQVLLAERRDKITDLDNSLVEIRTELEEARECAFEAQKAVATKVLALSDLQSELSSVKEGTQRHESARIEEMQSELKEKNIIVDNLNIALTRAEALSGSLKQELEEWRQNCNELEERQRLDRVAIEELEAHLKTSSEQLVNAQTAIEATDAKLASLKASEAQLNDAVADLQSRLNQATAERDGKDAQASQQAEQIEAISTQKATLEADLEQAKDRLKSLESILSEREEQMNERNQEYWTLKEELAELQELAERSREVQQGTQELEMKLSEVFERVAEMEQLKNQAEDEKTKLGDECSELKARVDGLSKAIERSETTQKASSERVQDLESRLAIQEQQLLRYKQDISTLRLLESTLRTELEEAQTATPPAPLAAAATTKSDDIAYLQTRIEDLENELSAKAEEVEEADSKILMALKEQKKYSTRFKNLQSKYDALEKRIKETEAKVESPVVDKRIAPLPSSVGRKRSTPEEVETESSTRATLQSPENVVRAIYAPSGNGFTPMRRGKIAGRPGLGRSPLDSKRSPADLEPRMPTTLSHEEMPGLKRSTSNPSELISARLSPGKPSVAPTALPPQPSEPFKPQLSPVQMRHTISPAKKARDFSAPSQRTLSDRTNMTAAPTLGRSLSKNYSSGLKSVGANLTTKDVGVAVTGGGGAADFLARMQRFKSQAPPA